VGYRSRIKIRYGNYLSLRPFEPKETALLDPGDDTTTYLELRVRNLELREEFYGLLPPDTVRALRDQLTGHLDAQ
jgi:hypothetical protein